MGSMKKGYAQSWAQSVGDWSWQPAHKSWTAWLRLPEMLSHKQVARQPTHRGHCARSCTGSSVSQ